MIWGDKEYVEPENTCGTAIHKIIINLKGFQHLVEVHLDH